MNKDKFFWWAFFCFVFAISTFQYLSTRILILVLVLSFLLTSDKGSWVKKIIHQSWTIGVYILILTAGLIYSQDLTSGFKALETNFSLIAIALIFNHIPDMEGRRLERIAYFFILGLFMSCVIIFVHAIIVYVQTRDFQVFFFYQLTEIIDSHPTYLAYYLILAITFGLYFINYEKQLFHPLISCSLILFFFLVLLLTGGQTAFVSLLLVFSFFILKFFLGDRSRNQKLTVGLVVIMMTSMFFVSSTLNVKMEDNLTDSWDRFAVWKAAIDANPNILFGVGTGDSKIVLNEYFKRHNLNEYANDSLNSHNQFIHIYLSNGLIGLLALLFMLVRPLYLSFKSSNSLGILVFFPFLVYGMTEVFLGRYQGVVFFALLHQFFVSYYGSSKPAFSLKEA